MSYDKKPEMILFDVGGTLFRDGKCIFRDGLSALRGYADNPDATDDDTLCRLWDEYMDMSGTRFCTKEGISLEVPLSAMIKAVTMRAGLKFSMDIFSQEEIFDRFNSTRELMTGIESLLATLKELGIRTAVISNNAMSGESLSLAIKRWIPSSCFEFSLTSADILFPKPYEALFLAAAGYAAASPENCWYCGDSKIPDVDGSGNAGMTPVFIDTKSTADIEMRSNGERGSFMTVSSWRALENYIKNTFGE